MYVCNLFKYLGLLQVLYKEVKTMYENYSRSGFVSWACSKSQEDFYPRTVSSEPYLATCELCRGRGKPSDFPHL